MSLSFQGKRVSGLQDNNTAEKEVFRQQSMVNKAKGTYKVLSRIGE